MQDFIDMMGASGTRYRFRLWADGAAHLPIAGNYVVVRESVEGVTVLRIGATNDLSRARPEGTRVADGGTAHMFTRLNVARAVRTAEHDDLVAGHPGAAASEDGA